MQANRWHTSLSRGLTTSLLVQAKLVVVIEHAVRMWTEGQKADRELIADVIEPCSDTSRLEVVADVTMIRLSKVPFCGFYCFIPIMSHTITDYKPGREEWCNRSVGSSLS